MWAAFKAGGVSTTCFQIQVGEIKNKYHCTLAIAAASPKKAEYQGGRVGVQRKGGSGCRRKNAGDLLMTYES
eukprot:scaffold11443_cov16-Tisochrysis_lutea.AAC.2